jgi:tetratricopeptide (TPR) repeat protein
MFRSGLVLCGLMLFFSGAVFPQNRAAGATAPRLEPDPRFYAFGEKLKDPLPFWQDILDAALRASGWDGDPESRNNLLRGVEELLAELPAKPEDRGQYILSFMHRRFLTRYVERQTRLDILSGGGSYNCVSSAVLYAILARAAGLEAGGVITRDHAFISLNAGGRLVDVETTNPFGFDPGSRREFHDRFGRTTGFAYVPPGNYRDRGSLSILELVSVILSNRISEAELEGRFNEGPGLALDRAALLSVREGPAGSPFFTEPERDVQDRIMNYGAYLLRQGREEDALAWADAAGRLVNNPGLREEFAFTALNNLLVKIVRAGKTDEARSVLNQNRDRLNAAGYAKLDLMVRDAEMTALTAASRGPEETGAALQILAASGLDETRLAELRDYIILTEGNRIAEEQGWPAATAYLEGALERFGNSAGILSALRVYRLNRIADLHNAFAELFNKKDYAAAKDRIQEALTEFPGDRQLAADLELVERVLRQQRQGHAPGQ